MSDTISNQPGLIYYAAPMSTYSHPAYDVGLQYVKAHYPYANVLSSRDMYHSNGQWQAAWPGLLCIITTLVFIADEVSRVQPTIGIGVYTEIEDCATCDIPIFYLTAAQELIPYSKLDITLLDGGASWQWYASIGITAQAVTDGQ